MPSFVDGFKWAWSGHRARTRAHRHGRLLGESRACQDRRQRPGEPGPRDTPAQPSAAPCLNQRTGVSSSDQIGPGRSRICRVEGANAALSQAVWTREGGLRRAKVVSMDGTAFGNERDASHRINVLGRLSSDQDQVR